MEPRPRIRPTQVLVLGGERLEEVARRAAALDDLPAMEIRRIGEGDATAIDVILSDRIVSVAEARDALAQRRRNVGRVYVGIAAARDMSTKESVWLPADATAREIRLACVLAAEAVRWRRRWGFRSRKEKRLRRLSFADPLTGVGNLRAWNARLAAACRRVHEEGAAVCVALFDVDHFKRVNDARGHAIGDEVLRGVAERLSARVRDGDFVARLGGDEFGLILANLRAEHGEKIVERVRLAVSSTIAASGVAATGGDAIDVTASAGWCSIGATDAADAALVRADAALRTAKRLGRDQTQSSGRVGTERDEGECSA